MKFTVEFSLEHFFANQTYQQYHNIFWVFLDEGVYNTYVLDSDYKSWALLLHCAEKTNVTRYLSSFIMSRKPTLGDNEKAYLRDKLPRYDIDLTYLFDMSQNDCNSTVSDLIPPPIIGIRREPSSRRHPMKHVHG